MAELNLRTSAVTAIRKAHERVVAENLETADAVQLEQELKSITAHFNRFVSAHDVLVGAATASELKVHDDLWEQVETMYNSTCVLVKRRLAKLCSEPAVPLPPAKPSSPSEDVPLEESPRGKVVPLTSKLDMRLDPVSIPSFDGALHNWLAFKDTFETLVHTTELPEAYKLGKLRQAVDPAKVPLVGGMYSGGYEEVWQALKNRFDNPKLLAEIHVSRLLTLKSATEETSSTLLMMVDTVQESLRALRVMKLPVDKWDALVVQILVSKLPTCTQREWCMDCSSNEIPSLSSLLKFVEKRAQSLATQLMRTTNQSETRRTRTQQLPMKSNLASTSDSHCSYCQGSHRISRCQSLWAKTPEQRFADLKSSGLCFNCLKSGHTSKQCSVSGCRRCQRKHHTMFCRDLPNSAADSSTPSQVIGATTKAQPLGLADRTVLLATARAFACGDVQQRLARILCDPGSQVSFVTDKLANQLNLRRDKYQVAVEGIGALANTWTKGSVVLTLKSTLSNFEIKVNALVLASITSVTPALPVDVRQWNHVANLQLADPSFATPGNIEMLIGSDVWGQIVEAEVVRGEPGEPCAQRTQFGWVVYGPANAASPLLHPPQAFSAQVTDDYIRLENLVSSFWKLEEVADGNVVQDECDHIFSTTHSRDEDGRYVVRIPFRDDAPRLGDSYTNALRQFYRLERRLASNDELREKYISFMREYRALNHMEPVGTTKDHNDCFYIPHHAVLGKFRVVFNASSRSSNGVSLNDIQLAGPPIQNTLVDIIFRFRRYMVALTADVEKMFRQVLVTPEHRDFQRILWRESMDDDVGVYRLTTVTYGMASSPFNAVRALQQCAHDNYKCVADQEKGLEARDAILSSFYVDDLLTSCCSIPEAVALATNISHILSKGCFNLRKWNSNHVQVISQLTGDLSSSAELVIDTPTATVLGLRWDPMNDELFFKVDLEQPGDIPTKRLVLSEVSHLFDPTGLLAPVVITGKIYIQTLWSTGIKWDTPIPTDLAKVWLNFRMGLNALNYVRVPRWLGMHRDASSTLHGFCDASLHAFAAVIYIRTVDVDNRPNVSLLTARTKVAPLKGATIPRLELCAAHLLAKMFHSARAALGLMETPYYLWSDSRIVLSWIRKHPTTLKPYASNRVRQIQELTAPDRWYHVRSAQNPADCASRGMGAEELLQHRLWWHGPDWLAPGTLPLQSDEPLSRGEVLNMQAEERRTLMTMVASVHPRLTTRRRDGKPIPLVDRFSSLQRLLHSVAYMLRWSPRRRHLRKSIVSADELNDALAALIRLEQGSAFSTEIRALRRGSSISSSSSLLPLNPFLDQDGFLRVGGRISQASIPHDQRFPAILPKTGSLVWLLIDQAHKKTLHGGTQLMLRTLRHQYWIINGRQAVRTYLHRCVTCRRHRRQTLVQQMASLPRQRVNAARPFLASGVDYCGPFILRVGTKRSRMTVKGYLAIFVCMVTKAVHIEVVEDLTAQAFLDAFTRFVSRRGPCPDLYSDNGTAFVGANRLLQEDLAVWHCENNLQTLANEGTKWHFIAPGAPHQGGLWEAAVKSAKHHLVRLVGTQSLWSTQLNTLAARIEACLNSRPLIPLHDDPDDKLALTPGDFLIGAPLIAVPEPNVENIPINNLKRWQWLRQVHQMFWRRWSEDYLTTLQTRSKWQKRYPNIKVGDVVVVRQEGLPPTHWRLGRVTEVYPGSDGLARNVTLKTGAGICTRAVQKLCILLEAEDFEPGGSTGQNVGDLNIPG